jgi:hypothetical protein
MFHCHGLVTDSRSEVLAPKGVFIITNPVCANIQLHFFPKSFSDCVVIVTLILMGLHGLYIRVITTRNDHKHFLCIDRRGGRY